MKRVKLNRKKSSKTRAPQEPLSLVEYGKFQAAFDFFNAELFGGKLPHALITLQRKANSRGYFGPDRFTGRANGSNVAEIALNPDAFVDRTDEQILSTLVHEMEHAEQHVQGAASNSGYHSKAWAARMKELGLHPSSTGAVGGKETGSRVSHFIVDGGAYARAYAKLAKTGFKLNWQSAVRSGGAGRRRDTSKTPFHCEKCHGTTWCAPSFRPCCGVCHRQYKPMIPRAPADDETANAAPGR